MSPGDRAARVSTNKLPVPQGSPQKSSRAPQATRASVHRFVQPVDDQHETTSSPAASSARRTAPAVATAPGESPCTQTESTPPASSTARAATSSASVTSAPGRVARHQPAVVGVAAVGEALEPHAAPPLPRQREQQRARHPQHRQVARPVQHRDGLDLVDRDAVVERAVRLEVRRPAPPSAAAISDSTPTCSATCSRSTSRRHVERHPAEVLPVGVGHLGTQRHPAAYGLGADRLHRRAGCRRGSRTPRWRWSRPPAGRRRR